MGTMRLSATLVALALCACADPGLEATQSPVAMQSTRARTAAAAGRPTNGVAYYRIDRQAYRWRSSPLTASSESWKALDLVGAVPDPDDTGQGGGDPMVLIAKGPLSVTFSGTFAGGPVRVRVRVDNRVMRPGAARFDPARDDGSRSFTFVSPGRAAATCHYIYLDWRAVDESKPPTLRRGTFVVTYGRPRQVNFACD